MVLFGYVCFAGDRTKDTTDYTLPQSVTFIEFLARFNMIGICYEPVLNYDSTSFWGAGSHLGLQIGIGTTFPMPFGGIRFDVPLIPVLVIGKEYSFEIGAGLDFQLWLTKVGLGDGDGGNTYNSVKLTSIIGYRHYNFGLPHHLFRTGLTSTLQADGHLLSIWFISFGI